MNIKSRDYSCLSGQGRRQYNEDKSLCSVEGAGASNRVIVAVADGMGGAHAGDYASEVMKDHLEELAKDGLSNDFRQTAEKVKNCIEAANNGIIEEIRKIKDITKGNRMGTTVSGAVVIGNRCLFFNVGDSRTYIITRTGLIEGVTRDHSGNRNVLDNDIINESDNGKSLYSHGLTRAVGTNRDVKVDIFPHDDFYELEEGDIIFSCTDGLWGKVTDEEIRSEIFGGADIHESLIRLYQLAYQKGSTDNISMAAYRYGNFTGPDIRQIKSWKTIPIEEKEVERKKKAFFFAIFLCLFFIIILVVVFWIIFTPDSSNPGNEWNVQRNYSRQSNSVSSNPTVYETPINKIPGILETLPKVSPNAKNSIKQEIEKSTTTIPTKKTPIPIEHGISNFIPVTLDYLDQGAQDTINETQPISIRVEDVKSVNILDRNIYIWLLIDMNGDMKGVEIKNSNSEVGKQLSIFKPAIEKAFKNLKATRSNGERLKINVKIPIKFTVATNDVTNTITFKLR